ncbi:MarR family transcriptional regulator [Dyella sp. M7H15-1]|nr:MarR family transcriptional regulator [Dyella sp. M7H15-1]
MLRAPDVCRVETPAARTNDPITSHPAVEEVTRSGQRHTNMLAVIDAVCAHPGLTSAELAQYTPLGRHEVARSLPEAARANAVVKGDKRQCFFTGNLALTWWPAEHLQAAAA